MTAIKEFREKADLTQLKLAEAVGVSQAAVAMWESGERKPDIIMLKRIASVLKCTADELLASIDVNTKKEV